MKTLGESVTYQGYRLINVLRVVNLSILSAVDCHNSHSKNFRLLQSRVITDATAVRSVRNVLDITDYFEVTRLNPERVYWLVELTTATDLDLSITVNLLIFTLISNHINR